MKKLFFIIFFLLSGISFSVRANLSISSFYVLFDANSPKRTDVLRISNSSNTKKKYRLKLVNFKQNADGTYDEISEPIKGNPFAEPYLSFSPHETTLEAGQSQTVRLVRKPMAAAADGEYVSHLYVYELPEKTAEQAVNDGTLKINIKALYGVTIPIIIDKGTLQATASLGKPKLTKLNGKPYVEVDVRRQGNRAFWGNLIVESNGQVIGRINGFKIFMTTPRRLMQIPLDKGISHGRIILEDAKTNARIDSQNI